MKAQTIFDNVPLAGAGLNVRLPARTRIRLWDLPVRLFHWSLVLMVVLAIITGELGGAWMEVHGKAGLGIVGLVVFRLVWGLIGSDHARFLSFLPTPTKLKAYLKGQWRGVGHNPLGALSVIALLSLLAVQGGTGLFSNDDISFNGPLFTLVDEALAGRLTTLHKQFANLLLGLLAVHVAAIVFYARFKRDNLVKPMVTGWKDVELHQQPLTVPQRSGSIKGGWLAFLVALATALAVVYGVSGTNWSGAASTVAAPATQGTPAW